MLVFLLWLVKQNVDDVQMSNWSKGSVIKREILFPSGDKEPIYKYFSIDKRILMLATFIFFILILLMQCKGVITSADLSLTNVNIVFVLLSILFLLELFSESLKNSVHSFANGGDGYINTLNDMRWGVGDSFKLRIPYDLR